MTANAFLAVVLSPDGDVLDVAYADKGLARWGVDNWVGRHWTATVSADSRSKIEALLADAAKTSPTRSRQVNHPGAPGEDLPVSYHVVSPAGAHSRIAFGTDLRPMSAMQQRLVSAQIEMEKDYRKLRDIESRYRMLFNFSVDPLLVVDSHSLKILEANQGAADLLDRPIGKLPGLSIVTIFGRDDQADALEVLKAVVARGRPSAFVAGTSGGDRRLAVRATPFRELGRTNLLLRLADDDASGAHPGAGADSYMAAAAESLPDGVVVVDAEATILEANTAFLDLIRVMALDLVEDKRLDNWLGGSGVDVQVLMANLREHGTMRRFSSVIRDEHGGRETVEVSAAKFSSRGVPLFGLAIRGVPLAEAMQAGLAGHGPTSAAQLIDLVGRVPLKNLVRDTADIIEKLCIEAALRLTDNNRASAADMLGLSRQSLYIKLRRYGISEQDETSD
ncbi:transcriptional regulator PpsR [Aureimonas sp. SA4125]|uniref:transcriptional regulator PpsR n=1 Tax=Aureimonas sp. SA4125 TaxID=2826993 RepID=UPI001CC6A89A|nr:transcriptional regulator PpsR [Aureimonas sp. SA4125]